MDTSGIICKYGSSCGNCGRVMGVQGKTLDILSEIRFALHRLRYYQLRRGWTCKPSPEEVERERERMAIFHAGSVK